MALRNVLRMGNETLRKISRPIPEVTRRIQVLLEDMAETMYANEGCGLAAPQVGVLRRAIVVDVGEGLIKLINPQIVQTEGEQEESEGCLSIRGRRGYVIRPKKVVARGLDAEGNPLEVTGEGLLAVALCHEIDHLDGVLFVDKMTREVEQDEEEEDDEDEDADE